MGSGTERQSTKVTRPTISYRNHHLRRQYTNMDNVRDSISGFKQDIKHLLKRKADKTWPDGRPERGSPGPSVQPEPQVVMDNDIESNMDVESHGPRVDENKSDWTSTVSASAKLLLRGVRDSADVFGPLKSVAGGLCFILENCEVRFPPSYPVLHTHRSHSARRQTSGRSNHWHPGSVRLPSGSASPSLWVIPRSRKGETNLNSKSTLCEDQTRNLTHADGQEIAPGPQRSTATGKTRKGRGVLQKLGEFRETWQSCGGYPRRDDGIPGIYPDPTVSSAFDTRARPQYSKGSTTRAVSSL